MINTVIITKILNCFYHRKVINITILLFLVNIGNVFALQAILELSTLNGTNGFQINGINSLSRYAVSSVGDVNSDGLDNVIIGTYATDPGGLNNAGKSYVIYGLSNGFPAAFDAFALDGADGLMD